MKNIEFVLKKKIKDASQDRKRRGSQYGRIPFPLLSYTSQLSFPSRFYIVSDGEKKGKIEHRRLIIP